MPSLSAARDEPRAARKERRTASEYVAPQKLPTRPPAVPEIQGVTEGEWLAFVLALALALALEDEVEDEAPCGPAKRK